MTAVLTLLFAGCGNQEPSQASPVEVRTIALNDTLSQKALSLLEQNGVRPDWSREAVEKQDGLTVYVVPTMGRAGMLIVGLEKGEVVDVALTLANEKGIATYLDLTGRHGLRIRVQDKKILASGKLPYLQSLSATSIDDISFLPEEPLFPQGYYDPTGCVPDALYERWIDAVEAYQSLKAAAIRAAATAAVAAATAASICATAETGVSAPACLRASAAAAVAAANAAALARSAYLAAQKARQAKQRIEEKIEECRRNRGSLESTLYATLT